MISSFIRYTIYRRKEVERGSKTGDWVGDEEMDGVIGKEIRLINWYKVKYSSNIFNRVCFTEIYGIQSFRSVSLLSSLSYL